MAQKAISPGRDRVQSGLLAWTAVPVFAWVLLVASRDAWTAGGQARHLLGAGVLVSAIFAAAAWWLRAATPGAAAFGGAICLVLVLYARTAGEYRLLHSGLVPLIVLFVITSAATRLGRERKARAGLAESRRGRDAAQIVANLGVAAVASFAGARIVHGSQTAPRPDGPHLVMPGVLAAVAALAEATADTVSSEIGQAFGGTPRMLGTLRPVPPGTDGAITSIGTAAGIGAAAVLALCAVGAPGLSWEDAGLVWGAGVAGLFFDSLLGATVERRGWIGNDLVNLTATAFSAALGYALGRVF